MWEKKTLREISYEEKGQRDADRERREREIGRKGQRPYILRDCNN